MRVDGAGPDQPLRIAFFGLPLAAILLLKDGHDIVVATLCRPGQPGERRLRRLLGSRLSSRPSLSELPRTFEQEVDLVVSWFWTQKLPISLITSAKCGGFGVHPSLLPLHRGPDPCYWTLRNGDSVTGVTAHRLEAEYDTGAVLGQATLQIDPCWDSWSLARALDPLSIGLLRDICARLARGEAVTEVPQEGAGSVAPAPAEDELELDFRQSTSEVLASIRAAAPYPGAWCWIDTPAGDELLVVTRAERAAKVSALDPGEAAVVDGSVYINTVDGAIHVVSARRVDDDGVEDHLNTDTLAELFQSRSK